MNKVKTKDSKSHQNGLRKVIEISNIGDSFIILDHDVFFIGNLAWLWLISAVFI